MSELEVIQKIKQSGLTDAQVSTINNLAIRVSKDTIEELCPALLRVCLNSEKRALKNQLGQVIFHLQKNERINTMIGLQKLLEASFLVAPEEAFKILESSDEDGKELAEKITQVLK